MSDEVIVCRTNQNGEILLLKNGTVVDKTSIKNSKNNVEQELNGTLAGIRRAISLEEEQILVEYRNLGTEM